MNNHKIDTLRQRAFIIAAIGILASVIGCFVSGEKQFFQSYLYAFIFWNGLSLGCMSGLMLHHLVAGRWGFMIQRILEAGAKLLPVMFLLFVPILVWGINILYPWVPGGESYSHPIVQAKLAFLNPTGFRIRSIIYFVIWCAVTFQLTSQSRAQDKDGNPRHTLYLRWSSAPGLVIYVLTMTVAATDWVMTLEPEWFSTIYGAIFIVGQGLLAISFSIIILSKLESSEPHASVMSIDFYDHLGSLMCAFVVLWSYMSFSQFLITWAGNLPEEIPWYLHREGLALNLVAITLMLFHFALPMFLLFQKRVKRVKSRLVFMATWVFLVRFVDIFWLMKPAFNPNHLGLHWMDFATVLAIGGLWVGLFATNLMKYPLLPLHDHRFEDAMGHGPEHGDEVAEHA